jgi:G2/mitotic-specific cyclin 3/4
MAGNKENVGGLKVTAKRAAFGDVSNAFKNVQIASESSYKGISITKGEKPTLSKEAPLLRPAQRPLPNPTLKTSVSTNFLPTSLGRNVASVVEKFTQQPARKTITRRSTTVFRDENASRDGSKDLPSLGRKDTHNQHDGGVGLKVQLEPEECLIAPKAPVHQSLAPRHAKLSNTSFPPVEVIPPIKNSVRVFEDEVLDAASIPLPVYSDQDRFDDHIYEDAEEFAEALTDVEDEEYHETSGVRLVDEVDEEALRQHLHEDLRVQEEIMARAIQQSVSVKDDILPASEPEEHWDEEDAEYEEDDGYVTARSVRSRGDNTTGALTTVLFPKVTLKVKKELAVAKEVTEATRTAEDIEDEQWDTSMVSEYNEEIFELYKQLEVGHKSSSLREYTNITDSSDCR